jgi:hypothetical protein
VHWAGLVEGTGQKARPRLTHGHDEASEPNGHAFIHVHGKMRQFLAVWTALSIRGLIPIMESRSKHQVVRGWCGSELLRGNATLERSGDHKIFARKKSFPSGLIVK